MSFPSDLSPYGAYDLAGNVLEWTRDWYDSNYLRELPRRDGGGPHGAEQPPSQRAGGGAGQLVAVENHGPRGAAGRIAAPLPGIPVLAPVEGLDSAIVPAQGRTGPARRRSGRGRQEGSGPVLTPSSRLVGVEPRVEHLGDPVADTPRGGRGWCRRASVPCVPRILSIRSPISLRCIRARLLASAGARLPASEQDERVKVVERAAPLAQDHRAEPPQMLALEVAADGREGQRPRLAARRRGLAGGGDSDQMPSVKARKTSAIRKRLRALVDLELLVLQPGQDVGAEALVEHDLLDDEDLLVDRVVDVAAARTSTRCPSDTSVRWPACGAGRARTGTPCR